MLASATARAHKPRSEAAGDSEARPRAPSRSEGYAGARIEPIARDAGVSTATLYALFDGKSELFAAVIDDSAIEFASPDGRHVRACERRRP
jgi:AcrR family transcriptional regulator